MKLGLLALSGIRAYNEKLTQLGLTLPGFVNRNQVIAELPSLGLLTLAGLTPDTVDLDYVELPHAIDDLPGAYDVVAISSFTARIKDAYALADRYRTVGTTVILGGLHVTACPDEAARHADSIVIGEGEPVWPQVIHDLRHGRLQPVYDARATPFNLADAPMPRFELLDPTQYNRLTVQTQRGCPFNCEFCAASIRLAPGYKTKPVEKVIAEIQRIKTLWPNPFIEFADDNTFVNKKHGKRLLRALAKEHVRWFTESDVSVTDDLELVRMMSDSGCAEILIGFEALSLAGLDGVERSANWKAKRLDRYREAVYRLQSHGIAVNGCFVMGLDGTGPESFEAVVDFARECGLFDVQVTLMTPFPGTPLYDRLRREGRILQEDAWELCTLFDINFQPQNMTVEELETYFCDLVETVYSEPFTKERRARFIEQRRAHRQAQRASARTAAKTYVRDVA